MKKLSIVIPCYNEQENIIPLYDALQGILRTHLSKYDYEILYIDNNSMDQTRAEIRKLCVKDTRVKAIFNVANFGGYNSPYYALCQVTGDCAVLLCADFQDPVEMIPQMVREWEKGHKVICMIKTSSRENHLMYMLRTLYYKTIKAMSRIPQIEHFTGFGLYDRSFLELLSTLNDPTPFLRGIVAEYAPDHVEIPYEQQKRRAGKSSFNLFSYYNDAMLSFTSYTKGGLRIATFVGFLISGASFVVALVYMIMKLMNWEIFAMGSAPILLGVFFFGGLQLLFTGLLGEYIMSMNVRIIHRPLVVEEERINFETIQTQDDAGAK